MGENKLVQYDNKNGTLDVLYIKGNISQEKPMTFKNNLHVAIISIFD